MSIMVNVMRTFIAKGDMRTFFRLRMVVESNGKQHWQIHQHQQPCKPCSPVDSITHYPKMLFTSSKPLWTGIIFNLSESVSLTGIIPQRFTDAKI